MSVEFGRTDRGRLAGWIVILGLMVAGLDLAWALSRVLPLALIAVGEATYGKLIATA